MTEAVSTKMLIACSMKLKLDAGKVTTESEYDRGRRLKQNRLAISGASKKLEMIISLDDSIKDRLMPV